MAESIAKNEKATFLWLSFADKNSPKGDKFLGVIFANTSDFDFAIRRSHELGINPGGEVVGFPIDPSIVKDPSHLWRLMSKEDLDRYGYITKKMHE